HEFSNVWGLYPAQPTPEESPRLNRAAVWLGAPFFCNAQLTFDISGDRVLVLWATKLPLERLVSQLDDQASQDLTKVKSLMLAAQWGRDDAVEAILNRGDNVNAKDVRGWTALMYAANASATGCIKALLAHHADPSAKADWKSSTALHLAAERGDV